MSGYPPELIKKFEIRLKDNVKDIEGLTFSCLAIAGAFILFHLSRIVYHALRLEQKGNFPAILTSPIRFSRKMSLYSFPFFPSTGHALTVGVYSALNIVFLFTFMNNNNFNMLTNMASRTGWLSMANMIFAVFLALKNTPLAFLTAWSYERLNVLHRYAGAFAVLHMMIHACCYSSYFVTEDQPATLTSLTSIYGIVAGASFFIIGLGGVLLRTWWYELFYYLHIVFFVLSIVTVGLHQPSFVEGFLTMTVVTAGMWVLDRLIRVGRLLLYSTNNKVILTPLPNGGTRVTLAKAPVGAASGKHCFLWIPAIRAFETHPFTISSMDPLEFVVTSHDGFTKDLHARALAQPGGVLKASVEGSYGTFPNPKRFDRVVLIAGGTGASFTFGTALNALKQLKENSTTKIMFIWTVRHRSLLAWYTSHLLTLSRDSRVSVHIFVTRSSHHLEGRAPSMTDSEKVLFEGSGSSSSGDITPSNHSSASSISGDAEQSVTSIHRSAVDSRLDLNSYAGSPIIWKRPDVPNMIRGIVAGTPKDQRVLVMGCGPKALMTQVRDTTTECIQMTGPSIELHCEQFGW